MQSDQFSNVKPYWCQTFFLFLIKRALLGWMSGRFGGDKK